MKQIFLGLAALVALALMSCEKSESIEIETGKLAGVSENGLKIYRGVPFAAPPVGDLRWKPPQAPAAWGGVRTAAEFAPFCPQAPRTGVPKAYESEDCLYLNVWTPAKSGGDKLPVMVWIHGGGFAVGSPSLPFNNGKRLAQKGVLVVNIAYRLGPLGFMAHPELTAESQHKVSGNYGLLDQIFALEWVQRNIDKFGGDPSNVTIMGESAGAIAINLLAASPLAKGLFHKAISQSGGAFSPARENREWDSMQLLKGEEKMGLEFAQRMGAADLAALRKVPVEAWADDPGGQIRGFWPIIDGYVIPADLFEMYGNSNYNDAPILIGTNSDEGSMFSGPMPPDQYEALGRGRFGPLADKIFAHYPGKTPPETKTAMANLFRDAVFAWPTWTWAKLQTSTGKSPAYVYYFNREHSLSPFPDTDNSKGAPHGSEMPFVMGDLSVYSGKTAPGDSLLAHRMSSYWVNFAKTGDPNGEGLPAWPAFRNDNQQVMYLNHNPGPGPVPNLDKLEVMEEYFAWKRSAGQPEGLSQKD